jgi:hypothetical protein
MGPGEGGIMEVIGIGIVMMLPIIGLGVTLILSAQTTKDIGNDL